MKAKIRAQYKLPSAIEQIVALPEYRAVGVPWYERKIYTLIRDQIAEIPLEQYAIIKPRYGDKSDRQFARGAAFPYKNGFGVIYADVIHLWEDVTSQPVTLRITNIHPEDWAHRTVEPLTAFLIPDTNTIMVLLSDYYSVHGRRYLCRLALHDSEARWVEELHDLHHRDFEGLSRKPQPNTYWPYITDILPVSSQDMYIHTIGHETRWYGYGMDYSLLAHVDPEYHSTIVSQAVDGFGKFSSDRQGLMILHLRGKLILSFYNLDGQLMDTLRLTPKRVLGKVEHFWMVFDRYDTTLWLGDGHGSVTCCDLIAEVPLQEAT